jgi:hypothetical protein
VAIKILPDEFARDADRMSRFQREAEVLASLNHPNIAAIYDFQELDGVRFLVLELLEGETLRERMAQGALPPSFHRRDYLQLEAETCEVTSQTRLAPIPFLHVAEKLVRSPTPALLLSCSIPTLFHASIENSVHFWSTNSTLYTLYTVFSIYSHIPKLDVAGSIPVSRSWFQELNAAPILAVSNNFQFNK